MNLIENTFVPIWDPRIILATITNAMPPLTQRSQYAGRQIVHLKLGHAITLISRSWRYHKQIGPSHEGRYSGHSWPLEDFLHSHKKVFFDEQKLVISHGFLTT
jgi:hypothetical protein